MLSLETVVVHAKCVFEFIFYWNYCLFVISNSFAEYVRQKNLIGFSSKCILGKGCIFLAIKIKHLRIIQFEVFHIKTRYLFIEYQKHISKSFDNSNHIFFSTRLLPHSLWSVLFTVNFTNYNLWYIRPYLQ
jgi:hypothetical protein